jgi:predicted transcriptional regulator
MTGIVKMVHRADDPDGPFLTIGEVAALFERDRSTVKRWCRRLCDEGYLIPSHKMPLGDESDPDTNAFVWCYTHKDMERLAELSATINPKGGRPKSVS